LSDDTPLQTDGHPVSEVLGTTDETDSSPLPIPLTGNASVPVRTFSGEQLADEEADWPSPFPVEETLSEVDEPGTPEVEQTLLLILAEALSTDTSGNAAFIEPNSYTEAIQSPQVNEWKKAMDDEMKSISDHKTWELVPIPKGKKPIGTKWVYKVKKRCRWKSHTL